MTLRTLKDEAKFRLSQRSSVYYRINSKKGGKATITSELSGNTYTRKLNTKCFPL